MNISTEIARHFKEVFFGRNWSESSLKDALEGVSWQEATTKLYDFNTIAGLTYHINYFVSAVLQVLQGDTLNASDSLSFDHPPINNEEDWQNLKGKMFAEAERISNLIAQMPEARLSTIFSEEKYETYYRNLQGIIEHSHYHLGQIIILKKLLREPLLQKALQAGC